MTRGLRSYKYLIVLTMFLLLFSMKGYSQLEPQYTQYMYNIGSINPGYVGSVDNAEIAALYRAQWIDIEGAPRTLRFGTNIPFSNGKVGMGINVVSDQFGPTSQTYFDVAYSYQVNLSSDTYLSFGIDAGGGILDIDFTKGNFEEPDEPLLTNNVFNKFYPTVGAGIFMYSEDWYLGASVPNFLTGLTKDEEIEAYFNDRVQVNVIGGVVLELSDNLKFKPAFLAGYFEGLPFRFDLSANFLISNLFTAGVGYRVNNSLSGLAGFQISSGVFLGYSYDYSTTSLGQYNQGSHEMILKFFLGEGGNRQSDRSKGKKGKPKQVDNPRFF
ncbi:PorP/SprF family type IX secretion system membrane protein [Muriicola jejuensis]|uniref:Type IX secretion system membrane protein PorP/SprF n=1 Tax=Muriicola jejuensis TaxID=504488 RepID=A0A6P0UC62_9FLAO|nr:type IX secretion system membrane protein PorP/SprF [Muriicola jejuensis]NER09469.1 type IX secretion system membrane protein PorP/SprF [Muriicola jejuensis]